MHVPVLQARPRRARDPVGPACFGLDYLPSAVCSERGYVRAVSPPSKSRMPPRSTCLAEWVTSSAKKRHGVQALRPMRLF